MEELLVDIQQQTQRHLLDTAAADVNVLLLEQMPRKLQQHD